MKENTVTVYVQDNKRIKALKIIESVEATCGEGSVYACVPVSGDFYEVTMSDKDCAELLMEGIYIKDEIFDCKMLETDTVVVSIMHLPSYVENLDIIDKFLALDIDIVSDINRHYYKTNSTNRAADGTRYFTCRFPPGIQSLPYQMKFTTVKGVMSYQVKHDRQQKICHKCWSPDHLIKECPLYKCYNCSEQGHLSRNCQSRRCEHCNAYPVHCECAITTENEDERFVREVTYGRQKPNPNNYRTENKTDNNLPRSLEREFNEARKKVKRILYSANNVAEKEIPTTDSKRTRSISEEQETSEEERQSPTTGDIPTQAQIADPPTNDVVPINTVENAATNTDATTEEGTTDAQANWIIVESTKRRRRKSPQKQQQDTEDTANRKNPSSSTNSINSATEENEMNNGEDEHANTVQLPGIFTADISDFEPEAVYEDNDMDDCEYY